MIMAVETCKVGKCDGSQILMYANFFVWII